jgi:hypothetical protein
VINGIREVFIDRAIRLMWELDAERSRLFTLKESLQGLDQFPDLIEKAKAEIGISAGRAFSKHVLRVEISGPKMPKLTLVDALIDVGLFGLVDGRT